MSSLVDFLRQSDIFYQFTQTQLEMVAAICQERIFEMGEYIIQENAHSKELYIIADGEVEVLVNPALVGKPDAAVQEESVVAVLRRGQSFGEIALVDEGFRSASVRAARKKTRVLLIPREKLMMLCETYPQLGYRLMYNLTADLAMKMRNLDLRIREQLLYKSQPK